MFLREFLTSVLQASGSIPETRISQKYANVRVTNQFGKQFQFHTDFVKDRAVIVNSMYVNCRGTCPLTGAVLRRLRNRLSPVFGKKLTIVSFTLEPLIDTVKVLHEYAEPLGANEVSKKLCDWHFVNALPADTETLRRSLNFFDLDPRIDSDITEHDAILLFGNDSTDRWAAMPADLREDHLVETIRRVAGYTFEQRYGISE